MSGRISKIRIKDGWIHVTSQEKNGEQNEKETTFKSSEAPHEDFTNALYGLEGHVRSILEWPAEYAKGRVWITGVTFSFSEKTEVEGAVISGQVTVNTADGPFVFNTPHLSFEQYSESGEARLMPMEAIDALEELRREAGAFVSGKRAPSAQADMFRVAAE